MKSHDEAKPKKAPSKETVERTEQDPAVERGERIDAGKQIARAGKSEGDVAGATRDDE